MVEGGNLGRLFVVVEKRCEDCELLPLYDGVVAPLPWCGGGGAGGGGVVVSPVFPGVVSSGSSEFHPLLNCGVGVEVGECNVVWDGR